ncbi:hypothetical protein D3C79_921510 [compost metagenome]
MARQVVASSGAQSKWRPLCSSRIANSTKPSPSPPKRSGIISAGQYSSVLMRCHKAGSYPSGRAMAARTAEESLTWARKRAALS